MNSGSIQHYNAASLAGVFRFDEIFLTIAIRDRRESGLYARISGMALEYFDWEVGDVIVLHLQGPITLGDATNRFRALIQNTLVSGRTKIILNMAEVYYMDSSGLGELVAAYSSAKRQGATLKLMKLTPRVKDLVQLTKVYQVFEVFNDEDSAVRSFA
jgi:anti-sigma B factor antagonist